MRKKGRKCSYPHTKNGWYARWRVVDNCFEELLEERSAVVGISRPAGPGILERSEKIRKGGKAAGGHRGTFCVPLKNAKREAESSASLFAPAEVELLNLWRDFREVVKFIDLNKEWLTPMLEKVRDRLVVGLVHQE